MKNIKYFIFLLLAIPVAAIAQPSGSWPVSYGSSAPSYTPSGSGTRIYLNISTNDLYNWNPAPVSSWVKYPKGFDQISGCAAPGYTPTARQSVFAVNSCTVLQNGRGPELYYYTGSAWLQINEGQTYTAGNGISISSGEISAADVSPTNELQTLSIDGNELTLSGGGGTIEIPSVNGDYLDSLDNEIQTIRQTLGTTYNETNMGGFTGTVLTDGQDIKTLIQELGDAVQAVADAPKPYWGTSGNTGMTGKFLGTTDTTPVEIRINNTTFFRKKYVSANDDGLAFGPGSGLNFRDRISGISRSTAFGTNVLQVEDGNNRQNTGIGFEVLKSCTTCSSNVGIGFQTLMNLTTASGNMAIGTNCLRNVTTGQYNVGVGVTALNQTTTGQLNIGLGFQALQYNTTGGTNVAIGYNSLNSQTFASGVVGIGPGAGFSNTSSNQVFIGNSAGYNHGSGSNCIEICNNPSVPATPTYNYGDVIIIGTNMNNSSALSNIIAIGSFPTAANRVKIGRSTDTRIDFNAVPLKMDVAPTAGQILKTVAGVLTPVADTVSISLNVADATTDISSGSYPYTYPAIYWRVPSRLSGWKIVGADYALYSAATGGNTVLALKYNNASDIASTTISSGSTTAASASISQTVATGDLLQATMPNSQTFSTAAKGLQITIYLTR